ncbi:hypothetical protein SSPO_004330 [Streptomyces antimycoticus]|uniref:N-methylproline demethylase n=1 Tax=Streptomyces antimycoticus TaxID=68175 RepID=A0A499UAH9_9ACTN|nr:FAD/NAD(P)-binding oxidoreductase [Streptomyces antimycoticus]BBJ37715.1 hypothetical protein SSPO_004330 [Streptomyces antimycoticus]
MAKVAAGDEDRIRPCVGASYCLDAIYDSGDTKCIHNAATGRELRLPHTIAPAAERKKAVIVGAGPAGLEAARVLGERGHEVVVFEAGDLPGGQIRIAASNTRRRDLLGIVDWRVDECKVLGVDLRLRALAEAADVLAERPDIVLIATGGLPNVSFLTEGVDLVSDTWDVLGGALRPRGHVLVYDDNGAYPGLDATELMARKNLHIEYVTPERTLAPDVGSMNSPAYLRVFAEDAVSTTLAHRLLSVHRTIDGRLTATLRSAYADTEAERVVDHVVVEHETLPLADLYWDLLPASSNLGRMNHPALLAGEPQREVANPQGHFQLFRIGDAVTSRNIHAAVLDALRLCLPM